MPTSCRLLIDPPAAGAWNMAVDEALLESAADRGTCTLRLYAWSEPTLSLGYFQAYDDRQQHAGSRNCPAVRRASGGGAILHDREITYSLILPRIDGGRRDSIWLYDAVHQALLAALARWQVRGEQCGGAATAAPEASAFLCFQRRARGDVIVENTKICGSAQRRRRDALLQHGSLILRKSPAAEELPGLLEAARAEPGRDELARAWCEEIAKRAGLTLSAGRLNDDERGRAEALAAEKYGSAAWLHRR